MDKYEEGVKGLFRIKRSSDPWERKKPCEEAFQMEVPPISSIWDKKKNRAGHPEWFVEVDDILEFARKYDGCIVDFASGTEIPTLEIYDDYREGERNE